jgi:hypothetical protein
VYDDLGKLLWHCGHFLSVPVLEDEPWLAALAFTAPLIPAASPLAAETLDFFDACEEEKAVAA